MLLPGGGKNVLKSPGCAGGPIPEGGKNSEFRAAEVCGETECVSELEEASKSLEKLKGDEVIVVGGGGKGTSWGKEKRERRVRRPRNSGMV
jgi:hypothetical protein